MRVRQDLRERQALQALLDLPDLRGRLALLARRALRGLWVQPEP